MVKKYTENSIARGPEYRKITERRKERERKWQQSKQYGYCWC